MADRLEWNNGMKDKILLWLYVHLPIRWVPLGLILHFLPADKRKRMAAIMQEVKWDEREVME